VIITVPGMGLMSRSVLLTTPVANNFRYDVHFDPAIQDHLAISALLQAVGNSPF
jgi:hypothetical protein